MRARWIACAAAALAGACGGALADWNPGDPHKMHFPQLPDPLGWDVNMTFPKVLADDWRCSETGPVTDVHFWASFRHDQPVPITGIHVSIHDDVPATPTSFSHPGALLWARDFSPTMFTIRPYGTGEQGWYDPNTGFFERPDHFAFFQVNITDILDPFIQELGKIYWLDLSIMTPEGDPRQVGWKTSRDHFNDDAVWGDFPVPEWSELRDPLTQESLDLAFVITPSPSSIALFTLAALCLARRKR